MGATANLIRPQMGRANLSIIELPKLSKMNVPRKMKVFSRTIMQFTMVKQSLLIICSHCGAKIKKNCPELAGVTNCQSGRKVCTHTMLRGGLIRQISENTCVSLPLSAKIRTVVNRRTRGGSVNCWRCTRKPAAANNSSTLNTTRAARSPPWFLQPAWDRDVRRK